MVSLSGCCLSIGGVTKLICEPEIRHKRRITVAAASKILANLTYAYKGYGLSMGTMLAGVRFPPPSLPHTPLQPTPN